MMQKKNTGVLVKMIPNNPPVPFTGTQARKTGDNGL
jgi:hypothetical protein